MSRLLMIVQDRMIWERFRTEWSSNQTEWFESGAVQDAKSIGRGKGAIQLGVTWNSESWPSANILWLDF
jgi:hypothetical protein